MDSILVYLGIFLVAASIIFRSRQKSWLFELTAILTFLLLASFEQRWVVTGLLLGLIFLNLWKFSKAKGKESEFILSEEATLHWKSLFSSMSSIEFFHFWSKGKEIEFHDEVIVKKHHHPQSLLLIIGGKADIFKQERKINTINHGNFISEMSFITGEPATATVVAKGNLTVMSWSLETLIEFEKTDPMAYLKVQASIAKDLVVKLRQTSYNHANTLYLKSMMANIKLGILAIDSEKLHVHPSYSKHLEVIFETEEIMNKNVMDVIFLHSDLGADELEQIRSTLLISINSDLSNFLFNERFLPKKITLKSQNGKNKIVELDWSAVTEKDLIKQILVIAKDITEIKSLEEMTYEYRKDMILIQEVAGIHPNDFTRFHNMAIEFFKENKRLIDANRQLDHETIKIIFINLHTMKGTARSLGLKKLCNTLHSAEKICSQYLSHELPWESEHLEKKLTLVESTLFEYQNVNQEILGRKPKDLEKVELEVHLLEKIIQDLHSINKQGKTPLEPSTIKLLKTVQDAVFYNLEHTFQEIFSDVDSLAKELGKERPHITINCQEIMISHQCANFLHRIFVHLIRNCMDHGLESSDQRLAAGKSKIGSLTVQAYCLDQQLYIEFFDDGRGLNLGLLKQLGLSKNIFGHNEAPTSEQVAQSIFSEALSTAVSSSPVSGRGMGMSAVKTYIENMGGSISIELQDTPSLPNHSHFKTKIQLPNSVFVTNSKHTSA